MRDDGCLSMRCLREGFKSGCLPASKTEFVILNGRISGIGCSGWILAAFCFSRAAAARQLGLQLLKVKISSQASFRLHSGCGATRCAAPFDAANVRPTDRPTDTSSPVSAAGAFAGAPASKGERRSELLEEADA